MAWHRNARPNFLLPFTHKTGNVSNLIPTTSGRLRRCIWADVGPGQGQWRLNLNGTRGSHKDDTASGLTQVIPAVPLSTTMRKKLIQWYACVRKKNHSLIASESKRDLDGNQTDARLLCCVFGVAPPAALNKNIIHPVDRRSQLVK